MSSRANIMPTLRYADAPKAIAWLCEAFGFEKHLVVPGEHGTIVHAELVLGNGMIMLGSAGDGHMDAIQKTPEEVGGIGTDSIYVIVPDADAHHDRAVAAGAEVVMPLKDEDYGGRGYTCRDLEGHVWSFGTFDPWSTS